MTETDTRPSGSPVASTPSYGGGVITADDPRFDSVLRGYNQRFVADVDYVCVPASTQEVVDAVGRAVAEGKRVTVRSGGHGFEGSASTDGGVLIDLSEMNEVSFDHERRAFALQPGATIGDVYRRLYKGWGVTLPAGEGTEVGIGGHLAGGGFGPLTRRLGAIVDYLCAVEVVVVDAAGRARAIVATDDPGDPHHDLWWAHTGGGGGNFGVVTRYWVRTPGVTSTDPRELLPRAPIRWRNGIVAWSWDTMTEDAFVRLLRDFGGWFERNSEPGCAGANLTGYFAATHRSGGMIVVGSMIDDGIPGAERMMNGFFDEVSRNVGIEPVTRSTDDVVSWLYFFTFPNRGEPGDIATRRFKLKSAYLRRAYTERQIATAYRHLDTDGEKSLNLILIGYGGQVNAVAPDATAIAQRDSILKAAYLSAWSDEREDDARIADLRALYHDVYAETGGVPVPNEYNDGAYINYPDRDLADPEWNTSGVPWSTLYYKHNYPRLQQVKKRYDPRNEFRHALSIELPD
ncbi:MULTISPECIES: FAD-dependent oxidoreductase [Thermomonospora]|uniref:Aclacinomycin oxidase n=1 Tax=Thermomonospora cellulosilytica TaxID=1411118 RepID=A0A7W3RC60_9ACTN|nr:MULTISPECIES: FAD-binding protein [Thermomonospora]MBA9007772.1 aclacinomycin oxidase [Thermomonospora cellulosilytica]